MEENIKAVIFDLGGVLVEWSPQKIARRMYPDEERQQKLRSLVLQHHDWLMLDKGVLSEEDAIGIFTRRMGCPVEEMARLMVLVKESLSLIPETLVLVRELHATGVPLYCLSNMQEKAFDRLLQRYDFWGLFRGRVISSHVNMVKPDPQIFEYLLKQYDLRPAECIFIDDIIYNIQAAATCGIRGIVFKDVSSCREQLRGFGLLGD